MLLSLPDDEAECILFDLEVNCSRPRKGIGEAELFYRDLCLLEELNIGWTRLTLGFLIGMLEEEGFAG
jgi:hypothetical protein